MWCRHGSRQRGACLGLRSMNFKQLRPDRVIHLPWEGRLDVRGRVSARSRMKPGFERPIWVALWMVLLVGCHSSSKSSVHDGLAENSPARTADASPSAPAYPHARWRLATMDELNRTVLWVSHILIRHERSDREAPFSHGWVVGPPPRRSREDARILAESLAARAVAAPETFARLAEQYSEDVATNRFGGSLGGVRANNFDAPILDALAALRPGEVSRAVATSHGYHVLLLRTPPERATLAARRIVVGYEQQEASLPRPRGSGRSREAAFVIARAIAKALRDDPRAWSRVLAQYEPEIDTKPVAYLGVWSNVEPGPWPREMEQLARAEVGEILGPMDGLEGVEVLERVPVPPEHPEYAVQVLKISYATHVPVENPDSRESAIKRASSLVATLRETPTEWDALRQRFCCNSPEVWSQGRVSQALVDEAATLGIGDISKMPVDDPPFFVIAKRLDPQETKQPAIRFDLPSPAVIDVYQTAVSSSGTAVQRMIRTIADEASSVLRLAPARARDLKTLHEDLAQSFGDGETRAKREKALSVFEDRLGRILTPEQSTNYHELVAQMVSAKLMGE